MIQVLLPDPDGAGVTFGVPEIDYDYDAAGRLEFVTDPLGRITQYVYENLN